MTIRRLIVMALLCACSAVAAFAWWSALRRRHQWIQLLGNRTADHLGGRSGELLHRPGQSQSAATGRLCRRIRRHRIRFLVQT